VLAGERVRVVGAGDDLELLGPAGRVKDHMGVLVVQERLQAPPGLSLGHQLGGRVVGQVPVLDAAHPGPDGPADRPGGIGVHHDVGAPVFGRLDRGPQLGLGVLGDIDGVVR
jgi:hypothetical protein